MKVRRGFVSNSSSSSFVCVITGNVESGYDASLSDCGFVECAKGHVFEYYGYPEVEEWVDSDDNEDNYNLPIELCPVCNGKAKPAIVARLKSTMKDLGVTIEDLK